MKRKIIISLIITTLCLTACVTESESSSNINNFPECESSELLLKNKPKINSAEEMHSLSIEVQEMIEHAEQKTKYLAEKYTDPYKSDVNRFFSESIELWTGLLDETMALLESNLDEEIMDEIHEENNEWLISNTSKNRIITTFDVYQEEVNLIKEKIYSLIEYLENYTKK